MYLTPLLLVLPPCAPAPRPQVCRVLAGPVSILWPSFTVAPTVLPASYCYSCWCLMVFVYVLQLVWFYKIVQIAVQGDKAAPKAAAGKD